MANDTIGEIFREILFDVIMFGGLGAIKDKFGRKEPGAAIGEKTKGPTADELAKRILRKADEPRGEFFAFILSELSPSVSSEFRRHQTARLRCAHKTYPNHQEHEKNEKYLPGDEDKLVTLLTKLYVSLNGSGKNDEEERNLELFVRQRAFQALAELDDEGFDDALENLNNDVLLQTVKLALDRISHYYNKYCPTKEQLAAFDTSRAKDLKKVVSWLDQHGIRRDKKPGSIATRISNWWKGGR